MSAVVHCMIRGRFFCFFFSSRRRHTRFDCDWSSDVCSSDLRKLGVKGEEMPKVMYRLIEADHYINKKILVIGGGVSAVEAAMGLGHQGGNEGTLSHRRDRFSRIKERNSTRVEECVRSGKLKVLFNSTPLEFREHAVVLEVKGERMEIPNDFVWIFAGGTPPYDFLKKIGVQLGSHDLTVEASKEAREQKAAKKEKEVVKTPEAPVVEAFAERSEERRVGKECRSRWSPDH